MDNNEILRRGHIATRLLADEDVLWFFRDLERDIMTASFNQAGTAPLDREAVYFQLKGIHDVLGRMETYSSTAVTLLQQLNENP